MTERDLRGPLAKRAVGRGGARLGPVAAGGVMALASALAFGATTPLVQRFGRGVGPLTTAGLLYAGAAVFASPPRRRPAEASVRAGDAPRLAVVSLLGAVVAPVCLAWGLQRTSGVTASLLLNLEALFTVLLARALWAEPIGPRVAAALAAMIGGGALLIAGGRAPVIDASSMGSFVGRAGGQLEGALAVVAATLAWAGDNVVARPLADRDTAHVVLVKASLGAAVSLVLGRALGEPWPPLPAAFALAACGAIGYGASLRLYLRAQRAIGAARTGSLFAAAPFVGAALAWAMGERAAGAPTIVAGALCAVGVWLHLTETHEHAHAHGAIDHDHPHRHDDGHHAHRHDVYPDGRHSHLHRHEPVTHAHSHGLDPDHRHRH
jgi:drug/metabolite transporter (DMT)-like permease